MSCSRFVPKPPGTAGACVCEWGVMGDNATLAELGIAGRALRLAAKAKGQGKAQAKVLAPTSKAANKGKGKGKGKGNNVARGKAKALPSVARSSHVGSFL